MSEKEFIYKFLQHAIHDGYITFEEKVTRKKLSDWIDGFLRLHHQKYYEVEFVGREEYKDKVEGWG
jgi:hypothetical protein